MNLFLRDLKNSNNSRQLKTNSPEQMGDEAEALGTGKLLHTSWSVSLAENVLLLFIYQASW